MGKLSATLGTVAAIFAVGSAQAVELGKSNIYVGLQSGVLDISVNNNSNDTWNIVNYDIDLPLSLLAGYSLSETVALEFEYTLADVTRHYSKKDCFGPNCTPAKESLQMDYSTFAMYGVFRTPGRAYVTAKAGLANTGLSHPSGSRDTHSTDVSYGAGAGFKISEKAAVEAEYVIADQNTSYMAFGLNVRFGR